MAKKKHQQKVPMNNENNTDVKDEDTQQQGDQETVEDETPGDGDQSDAATPPAEDQAPPAPTPEVTQDAPPVIPEKQITPVTQMADTMIAPELRSDFNLLNEQFDRYVENMQKSRPLTEEEGVRQQINLWRLIDGVLKREGPAFTVLFGQLLSRMNEERKGVLEEKNRYRFFGALPMGADENHNFEAILSALMRLSNPQTRVLNLKQVSLPHAFKRYTNKAAEARVIDFFGL